MSEEEAAPVSDTLADEEPITAQEEDPQQPQEATNEQGENEAKSELQEEEVGQSVEENNETTVVGEGEEGREGDNQQRTADEGEVVEDQAPGEPAVTTEEQIDGGGEVIEHGVCEEVGREGGEGGEGESGEDGGREAAGEERGDEVVMEEASTGGEKPISEVEGDEVGVAMTPSSDSRLVSASKMAIHPSQLENITEEDEEEEKEEEEDPVNREELLTSCKEALGQQQRLKSENRQLQHKIAEYLSHKKVEEKLDPGRNVTDQEKRYLQCMGALDQLEVEVQQVHADCLSRVEEMKVLCDSKQREVHQEVADFLKYQREGASQAVDSRSGRKLSSTDISRMQSEQQTKDQAVFQARLENIKLTNKIERLEALLKQKEELAEGLHMIDFEQLKISNVDLGEKVEERNEDITKLTGKVRATVEVLTHVKEKLHFLQDENEKKRECLELLDSELAKKRDVLTRLKQVRDSLRLDNHCLRQRGGLVSHTGLLRDFEDRQDQNAELLSRLENLKSQHTQNSMQCGGLRRRIENARHHIH